MARRAPQAIAALVMSLLLAACTGLVFQPEAGHRVDPADHAIEYRNVRFRASDGVQLHGWYFPAAGEQPRGTVVFAHGNAENISTHSSAVFWLRAHGYNVFAFDYRGYGKSSGSPSMPGVHRDTVAAVRTADRIDRLPRQRLILLGQSLGGAIAVVVTERLHPNEAPGVLVVDSAPSGYRAIAREKLGDWWLTWPLQVPLSWLITADYAAVEAARALPPIPKLFIGNRRDRTVPPQHARRLAAAATAPAECWLIEAPGHGATFHRPELRRRFVEWLDAAVAAAEGRSHQSQAAPRTPPSSPCMGGDNGVSQRSE